MYNYKRLVGELLGAVIAVVWISYALLITRIAESGVSCCCHFSYYIVWGIIWRSY